MDHKLYLMEHSIVHTGNGYVCSFELICIIDDYIELVWTDRYNDCGDFELKLPANSKWLTIIHEDQYLAFNASEHMMIVESISAEENKETGDYIIVSGRSLESLLDRRIIWNAGAYSGVNFAEVIKSYVVGNVIDPASGTGSDNENRRIPQFGDYVDPTDSRISSITLANVGLTRDDLESHKNQNLLNIVTNLCQTANVGFKITVSKSDAQLEKDKFLFSLHIGTDRSTNQQSVPYVIFSQKLGTMTTSKYVSSNKTERNFIRLHYTDSEGTDYTQNYPHAGWTQPTGISRREMYLDAGSEMTGKKLMDAQKAALRDNAPTKVFEAEIDPTKMYKYGTDYVIGDIVQFENKFGMQARVRVSEMVFSVNENEIKAYPTFEQVVDTQ